MVLETGQIFRILSVLELEDASILDFLSSLLSSPGIVSHPIVLKFKSDVPNIMELLYACPGTAHQ
jgi:hypothetical protein